MGRHKKENSRYDAYMLRMNSDDREMLDYLTKETGLSMAEVLRVGLKMQYNYRKSCEKKA